MTTAREGAHMTYGGGLPMMGKYRKQFFVGKRGVSKDVPLCFGRQTRDGGVIYDNCKAKEQVDPADREEAAFWMTVHYPKANLDHDEWYFRLWDLSQG